MSLSIILQPAYLDFARNPVLYKLQTDYEAAKGVRSTLTAALADRFATNATLTITYTEADGTSEAVVFTAKAVYDDEYEIPDNSFAGSNTEYWNIVVATIAAHSRIAPFFTVTLTGSVEITIQARSTDAGWDIVTTTSTGLTVSDFDAVVSTVPVNYRVLLEVYFEATFRGGDYALVAQLQGIPDPNGYIYFDISSVLSAHCRSNRPEPLVPVWATDAPELADCLRRYYVRYTEEFGEPPVAEEWSYRPVSLAMDGGISQSVFAEGGFIAALDADDSLLTWMPDGRKLGLTQPEFLAWYNYAASATKEVYIEMQWYDIATGAASSSSFFYNGAPLSVRAGEIGLLPVSPTLMGLDAEPDAYKYRVRVTNGITAESQWRTYYIDREYYESERYVQYLNSFGVPECWRCTGYWTNKLKVGRQTATRPLLPGYNSFASDHFQYGRIWDNELVYRTGFLTRGEAEVLQEMLLAGEIYDVSSEGYIPLQITTDSFTVVETRDDLRSYQFSAKPRLDMKNYSKKNLNNLLSGAWEEVDGSAWFDAFLVAWDEP